MTRAARLFLLLLCCLVLAACGEKPAELPLEPVQAPVKRVAVSEYVYRTGPDEFGNVCYFMHPAAIHCLKVSQ